MLKGLVSFVAFLILVGGRLFVVFCVIAPLIAGYFLIRRLRYSSISVSCLTLFGVLFLPFAYLFVTASVVAFFCSQFSGDAQPYFSWIGVTIGAGMGLYLYRHFN